MAGQKNAEGYTPGTLKMECSEIKGNRVFSNYQNAESILSQMAERRKPEERKIVYAALDKPSPRLKEAMEKGKPYYELFKIIFEEASAGKKAFYEKALV
jgi:hypothetical protein